MADPHGADGSIHCGYEPRWSAHRHHSTTSQSPPPDPQPDLVPEPVPEPVAGPSGVDLGRLHSGLRVGEVAIRIFRNARRRRLATPPQQWKTPDPGLVAELRRRGWDLPEDGFGPAPPP